MTDRPAVAPRPPLYPVLRADSARTPAFHRMTGGAGADLADALQLLAKRPELRICFALPAGALGAQAHQRSLCAALAMRPRAADRLILALDELRVDEAAPVLAAMGPERPSLALVLNGILPARPEGLRHLRPDFAILPPSTADQVLTADGAFLFGLTRQIADRYDIGLMVDGVHTEEQRERVRELGVEYLSGPAIAAPRPPVFAI